MDRIRGERTNQETGFKEVHQKENRPPQERCLTIAQIVAAPRGLNARFNYHDHRCERRIRILGLTLSREASLSCAVSSFVSGARESHMASHSLHSAKGDFRKLGKSGLQRMGIHRLVCSSLRFNRTSDTK